MRTQNMTGKKDESMPATEKFKDQVCGMDVDPMTAAAKSEYMGKTYYFCATGCKKAFDMEPSKYLASADNKRSGQSHGCCCQ